MALKNYRKIYMKQNRVFEVIAVFTPNEKEEEAGQTAKIVVEPRTVLAKDESTAAIVAARAIPEEYETRLDQVQVLARPF